MSTKLNVLQLFLQWRFKVTLKSLQKRDRERNPKKPRLHIKKSVILQLTRVGIGVAVSFSPLIRGGLLVEVVLRLHQRERLCEEGATAYRLVVPQTAVTAALLRAIRQVKRDAPLRLEPRAQNRASDVSALLCPLNFILFTLLFYTELRKLMHAV